MTTMTNAPVVQPVADAGPATYTDSWQQHSFRAMNTTVHLTYVGGDMQLGRYVESYFKRIEQKLSRFLPASELSRMNDEANTCHYVSAEMYSVLEAAKWAAHATDGLFDSTILSDLERAGYDRSFERISREDTVVLTNDAPSAPHPRPGMQDVTLNPTTLQVETPSGLRLDLGGIGKGWTVDRCADFLHQRGPFLLNAGGDLYAYGAPGVDVGWEIDIEDALRPDRSITTLSIENAAVATSTIVKRSWQRNGQRMHHIIDPRSGRPADTDLLAVTVLAPRVAMAEVYAKSALILGSREGVSFLARRGVEGILQRSDGAVLSTPGLVPNVVSTA